MEDFVKKVNITQISRLTNKTRPSIYKYINEYITGVYKDIPHNFVLLFNKINNDESLEEIVKFCDLNFNIVSTNEKVNNIITLIKNNYDKLDLEKLEQLIKENICN